MTKALVPDEYAFWALRAQVDAGAVARAQPFDLVWASFPWASAVVAASSFARRKELPLILDFRDSWGSWHPVVEAGGWRKRIERRIEDRVFSGVAAVTAVNDEMGIEIRERHPGFAGPIRTLSQGWDPLEAESLRHIEPLSKKDGILRICYGGIVRPDVSHPGSFFDALAALKRQQVVDPSRIRVSFFGNQLMDVAELAREKDIADMVVVSSHRERGSALQEFARSDVLLMIGVRRDADWITGKIWDYLTARRRILAVGYSGSAAAKVLTRTGSGIVLPVDDIDAMTSGLTSLWDEFRASGRITHRPHEAALQRYSMVSVAEEAVELFDTLLEVRG